MLPGPFRLPPHSLQPTQNPTNPRTYQGLPRYRSSDAFATPGSSDTALRPPPPEAARCLPRRTQVTHHIVDASTRIDPTVSTSPLHAATHIDLLLAAVEFVEGGSPNPITETIDLPKGDDDPKLGQTIQQPAKPTKQPSKASKQAAQPTAQLPALPPVQQPGGRVIIDLTKGNGTNEDPHDFTGYDGDDEA